MIETARKPWLRLIGPALILAGMLAGPPTLLAQAIKGHDSNAPVNVTADRIEVQDRDNRAVFTGNVDVTQADLRVRAARVTVNYINTTPKPGAGKGASGSLQIQRMIASGSVYVTRGTQSARGDAAVYDVTQRIITMAGNVTLNQNGSVLSGGRAVMNLATGTSTVDGRSAGASAIGQGAKGGRVSGTFTVDSKNSSNAKGSSSPAPNPTSSGGASKKGK
jgi:lipopolysaccharide export system protein LptA